MNFRSPLEEELYAKFTRFRSIVVGYEDEVLYYNVPIKYLPDFTLKSKDGKRVIYVEAKGWFKPRDRTKMLRVKETNPDLDIRFIFQKDNRIAKGSNTYYSDWCEKHGFKYAVGVEDEVISKWIKELKK